MSRRRRQERPIFATRGPFAVECPGCGEPVGVDRDLLGRAAVCPRCRAAFVVPDPDNAETESPTPAVRELPATPQHPATPQRPARSPDRPRDAERPAPATTIAPNVVEPVTFSAPPLPAGRIPAGPAPAATSIEPAPLASTSDVTVAAAAEHPTHSHPADEPVTPAASDATLAFRDPVKTVRSGNTEIEIRRLTPEEKRSRQSRRNLLILLVGAALLVALVVVLGSRGR